MEDPTTLSARPIVAAFVAVGMDRVTFGGEIDMPTYCRWIVTHLLAITHIHNLNGITTIRLGEYSKPAAHG